MAIKASYRVLSCLRSSEHSFCSSRSLPDSSKYGNGAASFYDAETRVKNDYEKDQREIEELMLRFLPLYMEDLQRGAYTVPAHTEQSLRHIFTMGAAKEYFYEKMPSMYNPLGLGRKAMPLACKVQNLLIADFLNYLALRHDVYLSATGGEVKKNFMTKP